MRNLPVWMLSVVVGCLFLVVMTTGCVPQARVDHRLQGILQGRSIAVCSDNYRKDVVSVVEYTMRRLYGVEVVSSQQCGNQNTVNADFLMKVETNNSGGPLGYMLVNQQCRQQVWIKIVDRQSKIVAMGSAESQNIRAAGAVGGRRNAVGVGYQSNETIGDLAQLAVFNLY